MNSQIVWSRSQLRQLFEIKYGKMNPGRTGDVPVVGSSGTFAWTDVALVNDPTIVVGRKGSAGRVWLIDRPCYPSDTAFYLVRRPGVGVDLEFVYYALRAEAIQASDDVIPSLQRHELENTEVPLPEGNEQRSIATLLRSIETAITAETAICSKFVALKAATMAKAFREGLRGEPLKVTAAGEIPESWDLVPCETLCDPITVGIVVTPVKYYVQSGVPCFRSFNVKPNRLADNDLVFISTWANELHSKSMLRTGDVLAVRTGYPGTACVVPPEYDGANCIDLLIARPREGALSGEFLAAYLNSPEGKTQVATQQGGLAQQHYNVGSFKRLLVPLPSLAEQNEIAEAVKSLERRIIVAEQKVGALKSLFSTTLHQLMTGAVRVNDIDFAEVSHA